MKTKYQTPQITEITVLTERGLLSASTLNENIYTDDPQDPENALTTESSSSVWGSEW